VQRVIIHPAVTGDFLDALVPRVKAVHTGDPAAADTTMGTLISEDEAIRGQRMIDDGAAGGARVLVGAPGTAQWSSPLSSPTSTRRRPCISRSSLGPPWP
jgi:acyl-CoA reductase-like NAD-dependent aldehyde dehydrogenase